ncbi:hypothetical protein [Mycobacterium sp. 141]|uniref:hypothetical protein n=1 Tax=Mycobacterium sp. 141 TaxID=1120797 RepID=UPI000371490D|nr:hypothetical protein [Mycobacterium sp. 141]
MTTNPDELTGAQQAVLLVLMAECRAVPNPELEKLGPRLDKDNRVKLNEKGLVESSRPGRSWVHELTDDGWATCRRIIGSDTPPLSSGQGKALYTVLRGLARYLSGSDVPLSEVFAAPPATGPQDAPASSPVADAEQLVREAYARLAPRPGGWVALVRLRAEIPQLAPTELDSALQRMYRLPGVHLIPEENQKVLTGDDRSAAVAIGDQDKHLIAIEQ